MPRAHVHFFKGCRKSVLDGDGKKISISGFKKGETVNVTSKTDSNIAMEVKKGGVGFGIRIGQ
jgi:hypothetical protein